MFRRQRQQTPPPVAEPRWRARVDEARALIRSQRPPDWVEQRVDDLERALLAADADERRLADALASLDPERSTRELKEALRARERRGGAEDPAIDGLRRRHDAVNRLLNRQEELRARIDGAVADLEAAAVRAVELAALGGGQWSLDDHLERLHDDLTALAAARDDLQGL